MDTLGKQLKVINEKLDALSEAVKALQGGGSRKVVAPYDRPVLGVGDVIVDGTTVNADGSVWVREFGPGTPAKRLYFGYISPVKTPEIFQCAKELLGDNFDAWFHQWEEAPYGIYKADVRSLIGEGLMTYPTFGQLLNAPAKVHFQPA